MTKTVILLACVVIGCALYACKGSKPAQKTSMGKDREAVTYQEKHRPQFHFSPKEHWMNDPNGMVFYEGEYHLFYQFYPDSNVWGPMHWAHAVSQDMVHWEHLPIALYPDSLGYIFSGSAVVDWKNTSGFGKDGKPPLVAMFTYHDPKGEKAGRSDYQYQAIAYSNDKGRTWTKYAGNPVIPNTQKLRDFRDPKMQWDEASKQWVLVFAAYDHLKFWASKDLKKWTNVSDFGKDQGAHTGVWECPDLFPLKVEGSGETKWVLLVSINPGGPFGGSATQYFVGNFDGKKFTVDDSFKPTVSNGKALWIDYGKDNYAGVTWSDIPASDGRRLFLGWMSNWEYATVVPTTLWRSAMTVPRVFSLHKTGQGYRLFSNPVQELSTLRTTARTLNAAEIGSSHDLTPELGFRPSQMELLLDFEPMEGSAADFGVELSNKKGEHYRIGYNAATKQFYSDRSKAGDHSFSDKFAAVMPTAPRIATDKTVRFHLFLDVASAELFADGGASVMTDIFFPTEDFTTVKAYAKNGKVKLAKGEAYALKSIWR